jgi:hypothetical protein
MALGFLTAALNLAATAGICRRCHSWTVRGSSYRHVSLFFLPYSPTNQPAPAVGGANPTALKCARGPRLRCIGIRSQPDIAKRWNLFAAQGVASMWYVARLRDARQWNSLVNTKEKKTL